MPIPCHDVASGTSSDNDVLRSVECAFMLKFVSRGRLYCAPACFKHSLETIN